MAAVGPVLHSSPPVPSRGGQTKPEATAGIQAKCILKQSLAEEQKHFYVAVKPPGQGLFWDRLERCRRGARKAGEDLSSLESRQNCGGDAHKHGLWLGCGPHSRRGVWEGGQAGGRAWGLCLHLLVPEMESLISQSNGEKI